MFKLDNPTTERYLLVLLNRTMWCILPTLKAYMDQALIISVSSGHMNPAHERNGRKQHEEEARATSWKFKGDKGKFEMGGVRIREAVKNVLAEFVR